MKQLNWPLMHNNILKEDREALREFLSEDRILTQSSNVEAFEREWSEWLGTKYSVFVNSGASANLLTMQVIKILYGSSEVGVPVVTWISDIASTMQNGHKPIFLDINRRTLGVEWLHPTSAKVMFITHLLGLNAFGGEALATDTKNPLIEDCCESHGATMNGKKLGSFGLMSNFSFYYAHHMTTIEGGMICTDDPSIYNILRMIRSHGLLRESKDQEYKDRIHRQMPDLKSDFTFMYPAFNVRNTELGAVLGRSQLPRLDANVVKRKENLDLFLSLLDPNKYQTDFYTEGASPYALIVVLKNKDFDMAERVEKALRDAGVEHRRGLSGGGNQLRQPYLADFRDPEYRKQFPVAEHIHFFSWYVGNYPDLDKEKIGDLCKILNVL